MASTEMNFDARLRRLTRKHRRMNENGIVHRVGPDGLVTAYPRRRLPRFPWRALLLLVVLAVVFKAFMVASLGAETYGARLEAFAAGTPAERAAAVVLTVDPVTAAIAAQFQNLGL